jgi:hypothetical protein
VVAYFVVQEVQERQREQQFADAQQDRTMLLELDREQIERILLRNSGGELVVNRTQEGFELDTDRDLRLIGGAVGRIVQAATAISASREIEQNPQDLEQYGLNPEALRTAEIQLSSGNTHTVHIGSRTPTGSGYYAKLPDQDTVYVIPSFNGGALTSTLNGLRNRRLPTVDTQQIARLTLVKPDQTIRIVPVDDAGDEIYTSFTSHVMVEPFIRERGVASDRLSQFLKNLPDFRIAEFVADRPEDLSQYGLADPVRELHLVDRQGKELHLFFGNEAERGGVYAKQAGRPTVFTTETDLSFFDQSAFELTDKFVLIVNIKNVTELTLDGPDRTYRARIERTSVEGQEAPEETYYFEGEEVGEDPFKQFYQQLIGLTADSARPNPVRREAAPEEVVLTAAYELTDLSVDRLSFDLVEYDRNFYAIFRDGVSEMLISKLQVERMLETAQKLAAGELADD